ncbi:hypothetical protein [Streptomyces tanashiensis]|uniref:hypothetical protein n=1 Tax=Streptomyces tanashiensis TaxID=67367 RepID=UPI0033CC11C4
MGGRPPDPRSVIECTDWAALEHAYGQGRRMTHRIVCSSSWMTTRKSKREHWGF